MKSVGIVRDELYLQHANGRGHPESPSRLIAINEILEKSLLQLLDVPARDATRRELARIHTDEHIDLIEMSRGREHTVFDLDTSAVSGSYAAAVRAAGGVIAAVDAVMSKKVDSAFAFGRPPGHHAEASCPMGFCLFNNVAVAAMHAICEHGLQRILVVDWDVHHGNGTAHSFYDSNQVLYFSIHEYPHYPGTGAIGEIGSGAGEGYTINVPLGAGQRDVDYETVFHRILEPVADEFHPELIIVSAGFDAHASDPLASMNLSSEGFGRLTARIRKIAESCQCRIVLALEGGYDLPALQESIGSVIGTLARETSPPTVAPTEESRYLSRVLDQVVNVNKSLWKMNFS